MLQSIKDFWLTYNLAAPKFVEQKFLTAAVVRQIEPAIWSLARERESQTLR